MSSSTLTFAYATDKMSSLVIGEDGAYISCAPGDLTNTQKCVYRLQADVNPLKSGSMHCVVEHISGTPYTSGANFQVSMTERRGTQYTYNGLTLYGWGQSSPLTLTPPLYNTLDLINGETWTPGNGPFDRYVGIGVSWRLDNTVVILVKEIYWLDQAGSRKTVLWPIPPVQGGGAGGGGTNAGGGTASPQMFSPLSGSIEQEEIDVSMKLEIYYRDMVSWPERLIDLPRGVRTRVESFSWSEIGGPEEAEITVSGAWPDIAGLINYLRCPVRITDNGYRCWYGYIHEVRGTRFGMAYEIGATLDGMANKVAAIYQTGGASATTAYATDADSVSEFGTYELQVSVRDAEAAIAESVRDRKLDQTRYPISICRLQSKASQTQVKITCRGWYETTQNQYYANAGTDSVATTTQIGAIVTGACEFLTATDIDTASGVNTPETRDGANRARYYIEELLDKGTSTGERLIASVDENRRLRVYAEPDQSSMLLVDRTGKVLSGASMIRASHVPREATGTWLRLIDAIPPTVNTSQLINPGILAAANIGWNRGSISITPRNPGDPIAYAITEG